MTVTYGIFSGGLDSMLAAIILRDQDIDVRLLTFVTPFFGADKAQTSARDLGLPLQAVDLTEPHLQMMEKPRHGFGRFMNPCIDCHALMFRRAGEIMAAEGGDFIFSGEVLGQRPMSQNRRALDIVAKESGFGEFILRPLSARCLPPTRMEETGLVDRERLLDLNGRTRKPQMALADQYGLTDYPTPAGGCLLTDTVFSRRLKELFDNTPGHSVLDIELLKHGRHFRLPGGSKIVVGRHQADNEALEALVGQESIVLKATDAPGPTVVFVPSPAGHGQDLLLAAEATASYAGGALQKLHVAVTSPEGRSVVEVERRPKQDIAHLMI